MTTGDVIDTPTAFKNCNFSNRFLTVWDEILGQGQIIVINPRYGSAVLTYESDLNKEQEQC